MLLIVLLCWQVHIKRVAIVTRLVVVVLSKPVVREWCVRMRVSDLFVLRAGQLSGVLSSGYVLASGRARWGGVQGRVGDHVGRR